MQVKKQLSIIDITLLLSVLIISCNHHLINHDFRQTYSDVNEYIHQGSAPPVYFKVHLSNGNVAVMDSWKVTKDQVTLQGTGQLFNFNRQIIESGKLAFNIDDIAIIETNEFEQIQSLDEQRITQLSILAGLNGLGAGLCLLYPKACFGSCPTFYTSESNDLHSVKAEGFSSAIAPTLEKKDLDALLHSTTASEFTLTMKNEALETHMVNQILIHAVPKTIGKTILHDHAGNFYQCSPIIPARKARHLTQDILNLLSNMDHLEYFSETDSTDLFVEEEIELEFNHVLSAQQGIAITFRQSLLTTFLLYSGLSYMGDEFGDFFAQVETNERLAKHLSQPFRKLGGIKVHIWDDSDSRWEFIEEIHETGPIAKNQILSLVPQHLKSESLKVKLSMTRGLWRIDQVALTSIEKKVEPSSISPHSIHVIDGGNYTSQDIQSDDEKYLISFPGNEFKFKFNLPELNSDESHELFLLSKGYYLEWMRESWLAEKNTSKLKKMMRYDKGVWKELAVEFKSLEHKMEEVFWNSNYSRVQ